MKFSGNRQAGGETAPQGVARKVNHRKRAVLAASALALGVTETACGAEVAETSDHDESVPHTHDAAAESTQQSTDLVAYLAAYDESNENVEITGEPTTVRVPGMSLAGIKFEPGTAERDRETVAPIEAFQDMMDLGLDFNNAHVQPTGEYHFHAAPEPLSDSDGSEHSDLVGFMFDGYPVYVKYGYGAVDDADGTVHEMTSSWQLKSGERPAGESSGTYDGTYTTDYEYVAGSGTLDECNGARTVTPEYPDGTYAYFVTEEFP